MFNKILRSPLSFYSKFIFFCLLRVHISIKQVMIPFFVKGEVISYDLLLGITWHKISTGWHPPSAMEIDKWMNI